MRDEKIADFDEKSGDLLSASRAPARRALPGTPRTAALLVDLRASMATLVETQKAKWTYMFAKIDGELRK